MASTDKIRKAASLIINCATHTRHSSPYNYKVLLLKRSSNMKVAPNRYVFPGGVYEHEHDASIKWLDVFLKHLPHNPSNVQKLFSPFLFTKPNTKRPNSFRESYDSNLYLPPEIAFRLCAIRETFEETGLLLAREDLPSQQTKYCNYIKHAAYSNTLASWFDKVNKNPNEFINMFTKLNLIPDIFSLYEWSNWLTPPTEITRFDAMFFICCLPNVPHEDDLKLDINESQHLEFHSPDKTIKKYYDKDILLFPPQLYELTRLSQHTCIEKLNDFILQRQIHGFTTWLPNFGQVGDDIIGYLPGDFLADKNTQNNKNRFVRISIENKIPRWKIESDFIFDGKSH